MKDNVFQLHMEYGCLTFIFYKKYFLEAFNFIKKETLAQVFSCEFCEISKNTFFYRTPPVAASDIHRSKLCQ